MAGHVARGDAGMSASLRKFASDESGATAIEYALIALSISIVIVSAATSIGTRLVNIFTQVNTGFK
jgi:pilus assembly protein Flp/PilA